MTAEKNNDAYFTPGMKEWFFYRRGMSPAEFEAERIYVQDCFEDYVSGDIEPLWKQMLSGEITEGMRKCRVYREGMTMEEFRREYKELGRRAEAGEI